MIDKFAGAHSAPGARGAHGAHGVHDVHSAHPAVGEAAAERKQIAALAQQFEAMLMSQMLREMKDSMTAESESGGFGADILGDTANTELSLALSRSGGMGLAESLMKSLEKLSTKANDGQTGVAYAPTAVGALLSTHGLPLVTPGAAIPDPGSPIPDPAVSSGFGWRADPLHGQQKFHHGTDIRLAYGQEVRAAAGGVVTFAGEQGGYGLVVKVDHGDGLETRYAHLSSATVQEGMTIEAGTPIARSGNSGRSTGAHLHFEVRHHGQPIDPERVIGFVPVADDGGRAGR